MQNPIKRPWVTVGAWAATALCALFLASGTASAAPRRTTIENIPPRPHLAPAETSPEQLVALITAAAEDRQWRIIGEAPGVVTASILISGKHEAVVTIGYDESNFWIDYKDSKNLNYSPKDQIRQRLGKRQIVAEGPLIHPNYNRWVSALADQIVYRMQNPPKRGNASPLLIKRGNASPLLIADELDKLDKLRQRGVLTQEEFDQQKAKLLVR